MTVRMIETTISEEGTDLAISAIFVPELTLDLVSLQHTVSAQNLITLPAQYGDAPYKYIDEVWLIQSFTELRQVEPEDLDAEIRLITSVLNEDHIVIQNSPPVLTSLGGFLQHASGVAIGAYVGIQVATALSNPVLLFVTVPFGMMVVGTAAGVGSALENGLRDRLLHAIKTSRLGKTEKHEVKSQSDSHESADWDTEEVQKSAGKDAERYQAKN